MGNLSYRIGRWVRQSALFCAFTKPLEVEAWAEKNSKIASPDQLISAHFIESIIKDFDNWHFRCPIDGKEKPPLLIGDIKKYRVLEHRETGLSVMFRRNSDYYGDVDCSYFTVKGVPLDNLEGTRIYETYEQLRIKHERLADAAREAKRRMEENEKKWNLAEELLGMKRNEQGALVPAKEAE